MKTYKAWLKAEQSFREFVQPEDEVDEAMVDYFVNVLPPHSMNFGYLQVGEPICQKKDRDGKYRTVYITFAKELGKWIYKGCCFTGKAENMMEV